MTEDSASPGFAATARAGECSGIACRRRSQHAMARGTSELSANCTAMLVFPSLFDALVIARTACRRAIPRAPGSCGGRRCSPQKVPRPPCAPRQQTLRDTRLKRKPGDFSQHGNWVCVQVAANCSRVWQAIPSRWRSAAASTIPPGRPLTSACTASVRHRRAGFVGVSQERDPRGALAPCQLDRPLVIMANTLLGLRQVPSAGTPTAPCRPSLLAFSSGFPAAPGTAALSGGHRPKSGGAQPIPCGDRSSPFSTSSLRIPSRRVRAKPV